jgi:hypothetical protein
MKDGIIFNLFIGLILLSIYLNYSNGNLSKSYNFLNKHIDLKLILTSVSIIIAPFLIGVKVAKLSPAAMRRL